MTTTDSGAERTVYQFLATSQSGNAYTAEQMTFLMAAADHFAGGVQALERKLYPQAVARFTDFLTTVTQSQGPALDATTARELGHRQTQAHFLAAVSLLGGAAVGNKSPQVIAQVENHLEQARSSMAEADTFHQASVLWAIVKEDSASDGMFIRPPAPEELRPSLEHVSSDQAAFLLTHLTGARGQTFADLRKRSGYTPPPAVAAPRPSPTAQGRPKAVTNYFTKPVGAREIVWAVVGGFGVLLLLFGLAAGDAGTLGCMTVLCGILVITALVKTIRYFLAYPKPSDRQMDDWLTSDVQNTVMPRALAQLRIDGRPAHEGGDLIVPAQIVVGVASPLRVFDVTRTLLHYAIFLGSDRRVRASYYDVLILFMTDKIVSAYQALLDTRTGHLLLDATQEHRYSDIAGVHSRTVPLNIAPNLRQQIPAETLVRLSAQHEFSLGIVNGNSLTVTVDLPSQQGGGVAWSNEQALSMIQRMIRGKKEA